jgi:hypothetical protein
MAAIGRQVEAAGRAALEKLAARWAGRAPRNASPEMVDTLRGIAERIPPTAEPMPAALLGAAAAGAEAAAPGSARLAWERAASLGAALDGRARLAPPWFGSRHVAADGALLELRTAFDPGRGPGSAPAICAAAAACAAGLGPAACAAELARRGFRPVRPAAPGSPRCSAAPPVPAGSRRLHGGRELARGGARGGGSLEGTVRLLVAHGAEVRAVAYFACASDIARAAYGRLRPQCRAIWGDALRRAKT